MGIAPAVTYVLNGKAITKYGQSYLVQEVKLNSHRVIETTATKSVKSTETVLDVDVVVCQETKRGLKPVAWGKAGDSLKIGERLFTFQDNVLRKDTSAARAEQEKKRTAKLEKKRAKVTSTEQKPAQQGKKAAKKKSK